jgi:hypothetical protein
MLFQRQKLWPGSDMRMSRASSTLFALVVFFAGCSNSPDGGRSTNTPSTPTPASPQGATYETVFPLAENPLSEGGRWLNGEKDGLDWNNVRTTPGLAFGSDDSGTPVYDDPTAILTGIWNPNQSAQGTVYTVNQKGGKIFEEVEIRLRTTITPHRITGYEIMFRCTHDGSQYVNLARWNGALGDFTAIGGVQGPGLFNGDVVRASISGNVITAYINGNQVARWTDGTFSTGNPGIGYYLDGAQSLNADYGFTRFTAFDTATPPTEFRLARPSASPYR